MRRTYFLPSVLLTLFGISWPIHTYAFRGFSGIASPFPKYSVCKPIPDTLKLCRNISYPLMRLPNFLNHETMDEVHQQARSWVPLLPKKCHPDLQLFLCSLFAPVCIEDGPIYPCRSLCEPVRDACSPVMEQAGFPWPTQLNCSQYPQNDMCINARCTSNCGTAAPETMACSPCNNQLEEETVIDHFCASEFVLKVKLRNVKKTRRDVKLYTKKGKTVIYKQGPLRKKELRKLTLVVREGASCSCPQLEEKPDKRKKSKSKRKKKSDFYLVMGRKLDRKLLVTVLHRWPKRNKLLRSLSKRFTNNPCTVQH